MNQNKIKLTTKTNFKKIYLAVFLLVAIFILGAKKTAQAQVTNNMPSTTPASTSTTATSGGIVPCGSGNSKGSACTLCSLIVGIYRLIQWGRNILLTLTIVAIFISGIIYIISSGTALMEQAKKALSASLIGFTLVLTAWLIVATVMWVLSASSNLGISGKSNINWQTGSINFSCTGTGSSSSAPASTSQTPSSATSTAPTAATPTTTPTQTTSPAPAASPSQPTSPLPAGSIF